MADSPAYWVPKDKGPQWVAQTDKSMITQTYYVGDITGVMQRASSGSTHADLANSTGVVNPTFYVGPMAMPIATGRPASR